jgi:RNA polymerase sigma-70 factor, ECF subfamily
VASWRRDQLLDAGFPPPLALRVARNPALRIVAQPTRTGGGVSAASVPIVETVNVAGHPAAAEPRPPQSLDPESRDWLDSFQAESPRRDEAIASLHALLLRAARFEAARRRPMLPHLRGDELDDIALEAADDALISVLARLDDFRGASRFTTWAYKFALLETAVKLRKRAWQGRELPLEPETWSVFSSDGLRPDEEAEQSELLKALQCAIDEVLTPHQRRVLVALTLNEVPIDVLAERLSTTRGALYKALHDARRKLRKHLTDSGLGLETLVEEAN